MQDPDHPAAELFDETVLRSIVDEHAKGTRDRGEALWLLGNVYVWAEHNLAAAPPETGPPCRPVADERLVIRVAAVGDLQLGDSPTSVGFGFGSRYADSDLTSVLDGIRAGGAGAQRADVVFGNLEVPLSARTIATSSLASRQMRGDPRFAPMLRDAGFTVLNVANNHAVQHGLDAFHDSVAALKAAGISPCGLRGEAPWASAPVILVANSVRVGVLAYCLRPRQYGERRAAVRRGIAGRNPPGRGPASPRRRQRARIASLG